MPPPTSPAPIRPIGPPRAVPAPSIAARLTPVPAPAIARPAPSPKFVLVSSLSSDRCSMPFPAKAAAAAIGPAPIDAPAVPAVVAALPAADTPSAPAFAPFP